MYKIANHLKQSKELSYGDIVKQREKDIEDKTYSESRTQKAFDLWHKKFINNVESIPELTITKKYEAPQTKSHGHQTAFDFKYKINNRAFTGRFTLHLLHDKPTVEAHFYTKGTAYENIFEKKITDQFTTPRKLKSIIDKELRPFFTKLIEKQKQDRKNQKDPNYPF